MNSAIVPTKVLSDPMELERTLQSGLLQSAAAAQAAAAAQVAAVQAAAAAANGLPATSGFEDVNGGETLIPVPVSVAHANSPDVTILQVFDLLSS